MPRRQAARNGPLSRRSETRRQRPVSSSGCGEQTRAQGQRHRRRNLRPPCPPLDHGNRQFPWRLLTIAQSSSINTRFGSRANRSMSEFIDSRMGSPLPLGEFRPAQPRVHGGGGTRAKDRPASTTTAHFGDSVGRPGPVVIPKSATPIDIFGGVGTSCGNHGGIDSDSLSPPNSPPNSPARRTTFLGCIV